MQDQGYSAGAIVGYLRILPTVVGWLQRHQIKTLAQLTHQELRLAHDYFRPRQQAPSWVIRALDRFLCEHHLVAPGEAPTPRNVEVKVAASKLHLRETRGLTETTIHGHAGLLRTFLKFLRLDRDPYRLERLQSAQIEAFLRQSARTNNRFSLQHIVATLRAFLRWQHAQGFRPRPLHLEIDTPRVYRGERLPRALPWAQVQGAKGQVTFPSALV